MINGWQSYYKIKPVINGDIDFYKITFPYGAKSRDTVKVPEKVEENIIGHLLV
ncbi:MAG: hypothetical protein HZA48_11980 [Planctomycetes bacterium]|nr:hypothetical protein [Planctomycetota bacterium]